tara:strand:- start:293 stop:745 length:453 start_codon:yes stop_codon:yes gene_type:complete
VLAFGLYHNLERGLTRSIEKTYRVLEHGGSVCASFRADIIQTRLTDWLTGRKTKASIEKKIFHKMNLKKSEFKKIFENAGFVVNSIVPVENMPILYKFPFFRASGHNTFDENLARFEGYKLSWFGQKLQRFLMRYFPDQFCNVYVLIAKK